MKTVYDAPFSDPEAPDGRLLILIEDGVLLDLLHIGNGNEDIGAIYIGRVDRKIKGMGGAFVDLGHKKKAFLRLTKESFPEEGKTPLQIVQNSDNAKPLRVSNRIDLRGRFAVLTPHRPGINFSRKMNSPEMLTALRTEITALIPQDCGAIIRSDAQNASKESVLAEIKTLSARLENIRNTQNIGLVYPAQTGAQRAQIEWGDASYQLVDDLPDHVLEILAQALQNPLPCGTGNARIEPTRALIAVDVDTHSALDTRALGDVNLALARKLPRYLRLMGWGGQIVIDTAPMALGARKGFDSEILAAAKKQGLGLISSGFGPLGLWEGRIKYERRPLSLRKLQRLLGF